MTSSIEKWPVEIRIVKISSSVLSSELTLYLFSGVMNRNQADTIKKRLSILSEFEIEANRLVLTSVINRIPARRSLAIASGATRTVTACRMRVRSASAG